MDTDFELVTHASPIDLTPIKDPGMKALVQLAVSLGWNVHQKHGQPVVITARDGIQKRLPTNTSIRMSVFQTALSTIMVHTEEDKIPTIDLIDAIIKATKPSVDHQRRLRLAVGESPTQHRDRVASAEVEAKGPRDPQPLTTRIEIPEEQWEMVKDLIDGDDDEVAARAAADGGEHGEVVSREPYQAVKASSNTTTVRYVSDTSYQRTWTDGYVDYECMKCAKAFTTSKGAGAHSQIHGAAPGLKPWQRTEQIKVPREPKPVLMWEEPPAEEEPIVTKTGKVLTDEDIQALADEAERGYPVIVDTTAARLLATITALVAPDLVAKVEFLEAENLRLRERLAEVEGEFDAFIDLATSRRKKPDGD